MPRRLLLASTAAMGLLLSLASCGDDEPGGSGSGGGPSTSGPSTGAGAGSAQPCGIEGAVEIVAPRTYGEGSVIPRIVVDGDDLFFGTLDEIHHVPRTGGEPSRVYPPEPIVAVYPAFWLRGDELIVGGLDELRVLPRTGGAITRTLELPLPYAATLTGVSYVQLADDGDTLFAKHDGTSVLDDEGPSFTYYAYDLAAEASSVLAEATPIGVQGMLVPVGDHVYVAHQVADPFDPDDARPDELHRIPVGGGAPERVAITGDLVFDLLGSDGADLYLHGRPVAPEGGDLGGVYRLPVAGGAPAKVVDQFVPVDPSVTELVALADRTLIWLLDTVHEVPRGGGEASVLLEAQCEVHAFAASEDDVFLSVFDESTEASSIVRVPLR